MEFPSYYSIGAYSGLVFNEYWEVFPEAYWRYFELEGDGRLILTSDFLTSEPDQQHEILKSLKGWQENSTRIGQGMEGGVYKVGDSDYVIKAETNPLYFRGKSPDERFINAAYLRDRILSELPSWADIVPRYLCLIDRYGDRYTVMPKVADGITLNHLFSYCHPLSSRNPQGVDRIIRANFPNFGRDEYARVKDEFYHLNSLVRDLFEVMFPGTNGSYDLNMGNVLVSPLTEPVDGYNYMLSLIDL